MKSIHTWERRKGTMIDEAGYSDTLVCHFPPFAFHGFMDPEGRKSISGDFLKYH